MENEKKFLERIEYKFQNSLGKKYVIAHPFLYEIEKEYAKNIIKKN